MAFFGVPLGSLLAAGAVTGTALVALYLLRPSRRRVEIPYARLWGLRVTEARASSLARRLRRWESLLLQLLIAALILLALGDPHLGGHGATPRHVILVDTSASMQAVERAGDLPRIERARRAADGVVDALEPDEEAMIVAFDSTPRPLSPLTTEEPALRAAIAKLSASDAPDALLPALSFAADALAGAPQARITLISDGGFDGEAFAALERGLPTLNGIDVRYLPTGGPALPPSADAESDNVAITAFSVRRYPANPTAYEILAEVTSFSAKPRTARLTITQEGETVETTALSLPPHGHVLRRLSDLSGEGRHLEARISIDGFDPLPLDDRAYALLSDRKKTRVLLVGAGDLYAEGALLLDRSVEVVKKAPKDYAEGALESFDVVLFDGFTPPAMPPRPALYLGCEAPGCPFTTHGTADAPIVTEVEREHPLLRWVALKDLNVSRATVYAPQRGDVALASSLGRPILIAGERGGRRAIALGFAPMVSDLPLRVAFPVFLVNALAWLRGGTADATDAVRTGHPARLASDHDVDVTAPGGDAVHLPARDGRVELDARRVGFYRFGERDIAANLADPRESLLASRTLAIAGKPLAAPPAMSRLRPRAALWRWLVLLALVLVVAEWWTFHRRWTV